MRLHRNAKTTPLMRQLIVDRVMRQHWTQARAAEAAGVSVRTVTKWVARWRAGDLTCLDAASRPHRQPRRLAVATVSQIVQLRQTRATAWQISTALQVPPLDRHPRPAPGRPESAEGARTPARHPPL